MKKILCFAILFVSCFVIFLPVLADIIDEDIRQLEQAIKSFNISGVSISASPVEIESTLTAEDFKLKKKTKNRRFC